MGVVECVAGTTGVGDNTIVVGATRLEPPHSMVACWPAPEMLLRAPPIVCNGAVVGSSALYCGDVAYTPPDLKAPT